MSAAFSGYSVRKFGRVRNKLIYRSLNVGETGERMHCSSSPLTYVLMWHFAALSLWFSFHFDSFI